MSEQQKENAATQEAAANEQYIQRTNNLDSLNNLIKAADNYRQGIRKEVWATGFSNLDAALDGGLHGSQLVCIGAISSLGKTSFVLQAATQMAEQGRDVLIFSLEMSRDELNAKTVSRYSHILRNKESLSIDITQETRTQFTTRDILKGDVDSHNPQSLDFFTRSVEMAKAVAAHTYIYVGNNDVSVDTVKEVVQRHYTATGKKPAVILDYLQILNPSDEAVKKHYDVRRSTNDDITKLKVLARDFDIPVIVISAFNRASYTDPVSMSSFRESSGIEYSADVLIGLQYRGMDYEQSSFYTQDGKAHGSGRESEADHYTRVIRLFEEMQSTAAEGGKQPIELKLLKNRNGSRGTLWFDFTPKYNYFKEFAVLPEQQSSGKPTQAATGKERKKL